MNLRLEWKLYQERNVGVELFVQREEVREYLEMLDRRPNEWKIKDRKPSEASERSNGRKMTPLDV